MTDNLPDSAPAGRRVCLGCEPEADPIAEILDLFWCFQHPQSDRGSEYLKAEEGLSDIRVTSGESDGHTNRLYMEALRKHEDPPGAVGQNEVDEGGEA
jgi:hypothetical protein